jgi:LysM repeat protein
MGAVRQMGNGILYGLVSVMLVVGGLSLALAESYTAPSPTPTGSLPTVPETLTSTPAGPTAYPSATFLPTATLLPPTYCPPPAGWILIAVQPYDTLENLAQRFRISPYQLAQANCLLTDNLAPGYTIYIPPPPLPPPTQIIFPCSAPFGWVRGYIVKPGDTLYRIAGSFGVSVYELQRANCLQNAFITPGNLLWVPYVPAVTPSVIIHLNFGTLTPTASETEIPTDTPSSTPLPPTATTAPTATLPLTPFPSSIPAYPTPTVMAFPTTAP